MISHPETGSDSPIGSDRDRGRHKFPKNAAHVHRRRDVTEPTFSSNSLSHCNVVFIGRDVAKTPYADFISTSRHRWKFLVNKLSFSRHILTSIKGE